MKKLLVMCFILTSVLVSAQTRPSYLQLTHTPLIDIRIFGAKPNDGVCDGAAIASAVALGDILIPEGVWDYKLSTPVSLTHSVFGINDTSTIIKVGSDTHGNYTVFSGTTDGVEIRHIGFDGGATGYKSDALPGAPERGIFLFRGAQNILVENVIISNVALDRDSAANVLNGCAGFINCDNIVVRDFQMINCWGENLGFNGTNRVIIDTAKFIHTSKCMYSAINITPDMTASPAVPVGGFQINNIYITGGLASALNVLCKDTQISNVFITNSAKGVEIGYEFEPTAPSLYCNNVTLTNYTFRGVIADAYQYGLLLNGDNLVVSNFIISGTQTPLYIRDANTVMVNNGTLKNCGRRSNLTDSTGVTLSNVIMTDFDTANSTTYSLNRPVFYTSSVNNLTFSNVHVTATSAQNIVSTGAGDQLGWSFINCDFYGYPGVASTTAPSLDYAVLGADVSSATISTSNIRTDWPHPVYPRDRLGDGLLIGTVSPVGVIDPDFKGQLYLIPASSTFHIATGSSNLNWQEL
jgi:hypothetical protein